MNGLLNARAIHPLVSEIQAQLWREHAEQFGVEFECLFYGWGQAGDEPPLWQASLVLDGRLVVLNAGTPSWLSGSVKEAIWRAFVSRPEMREPKECAL